MRQTLFLLALLLAWPLAGCATRASLPVLIDAEGEPVAFKRRERTVERDYLRHFTRTAYRSPSIYFRPAPGAQQTLIEEWGEPDWVRTLRSLHGERVREWLYINDARLFQFIGRELVFEGPLTDYEQLLILRGRPDRAEVLRNAHGNTEDLFLYTGFFNRILDHFYMVDGKLIQSTEGN